MQPGRGFVREHDAKHGRLLGAEGTAANGRPLGATIHVSGIHKTISASSTFGDFYRWLQPSLLVFQPHTDTSLSLRKDVNQDIVKGQFPSCTAVTYTCGSTVTQAFAVGLCLPWELELEHPLIFCVQCLFRT